MNPLFCTRPKSKSDENKLSPALTTTHDWISSSGYCFNPCSLCIFLFPFFCAFFFYLDRTLSLIWPHPGLFFFYTKTFIGSPLDLCVWALAILFFFVFFFFSSDFLPCHTTLSICRRSLSLPCLITTTFFLLPFFPFFQVKNETTWKEGKGNQTIINPPHPIIYNYAPPI